MEPELRGGNRTQSRAAASRPGSQPERIAVSTSSDQSAGAELQEAIAELSTPKMSQAGSGWVGLSDPRTLREICAGKQASHGRGHLHPHSGVEHGLDAWEISAWDFLTS